MISVCSLSLWAREARLTRVPDSKVRFTCQTAMRNPPRPSSAPRVAVVSPPWHGGCLPSKIEGRSAEWRPEYCTPCGVRVPLAKGTQRPSALRAAVFGHRGRASADRAFPALALGVAIITVANGSREGRSAPGASPGPPEGRACEARGAGRRTPLRFRTHSGGALDERGCRNIYVGT